MKLSGYKKYKDSCIPWLGAIPISWTASPLKFHLERNDGGVWGDDPDGANDTIVLRSTEQTVDGHWAVEDPAPRKLPAADIRAGLLEENDLLVTKSSGSSLHIGKTTIVGSEIAQLRCCYSNFMQRLRTAESLRPKYAWYLMNHRIMREQFDLNSNSTTGLANLNASILGAALIAVPPLAEQDSILHFLDRETAKIDALIAKQEQLIATLREDRTATITHAVTKGLDPSAEMKESGVQWIGSVPAHWSVTAVKRVARIFVPDRDKPELHETGELPWVTMENIGCRAPTPSILFVRKSDSVNRTASSGTVLASCIGRFGLASVLDADSVVNQQLQGYIPSDRLDRYFLWYFVQQAGMYFEAISTSTTLPYVNQQGFGNLPIGLPAPQEQERIVCFLDRQTTKFEALITKSQQVIETLQEYRSALITDAVTGKIDVRGAA